MGKIVIKRKNIPKEMRKVLVDVGMRSKDYAFMMQHVMTLTPQEVSDLASDPDTPIAVGIVCHTLIKDFKSGNIKSFAPLLEWMLNHLPEDKPHDDISNLDETALDEEIKKLLDQT